MLNAVDFESSLRETLLSCKPLTDIVDNRIFALHIPQGTRLPCVTYQRISGRPANTLTGFSGLESIDVQIDCWSQDYSQAKNIAKAVRAAMPQDGAPWAAHLRGDADLFEDTVNYFRVMMRWTVWLCENVED